MQTPQPTPHQPLAISPFWRTTVWDLSDWDRRRRVQSDQQRRTLYPATEPGIEAPATDAPPASA
jgi:hypothetical protein